MSPKFKILVTDVLGGTSRGRTWGEGRNQAQVAGIGGARAERKGPDAEQKGSGLTPGPDSRKLKDCEGCGSSCILHRIIFPETGQASPPLTAGLRIKEEQWQTMYQR